MNAPPDDYAAQLARLERDELWCAHYLAWMELATMLDPLSHMVARLLGERMDALAQEARHD